MMTIDEFENDFGAGLFDEEYMEYIQLNADPLEHPVYNGNSLIELFESEYLLDEFRCYVMTREDQ
jgi:hypothetical protein